MFQHRFISILVMTRANPTKENKKWKLKPPNNLLSLISISANQCTFFPGNSPKSEQSNFPDFQNQLKKKIQRRKNAVLPRLKSIFSRSYTNWVYWLLLATTGILTKPSLQMNPYRCSSYLSSLSGLPFVIGSSTYLLTNWKKSSHAQKRRCIKYMFLV